ncbi:MAG: hypothetical protein ACOY3I_05440 [Verrucomicrobiota bacterium]
MTFQEHFERPIEIFDHARWELLDRIGVYFRREYNPEESEEYLNRMVRSLLLPTEQAFQETPAKPYAHFECGESTFWSKHPEFIQKEWHQRWHKKILESMPVCSRKDFEKEVHQHRILCRSANWKTKGIDKICSAHAGNFEKVVLLPPENSNGWVLKMGRVRHFMIKIENIIIHTNDQGGVHFVLKKKELLSPADILLDIQGRHAFECFSSTSVALLEGSGLLFREKFLPRPTPKEFESFAHRGIFRFAYTRTPNDQRGEIVFKTQNNQLLCVWDALIGNCVHDADGVKLMDCAQGLFKPTGKLKIIHDQLCARREKTVPVKMDLPAFKRWEKLRKQHQYEAQEMRRFLESGRPYSRKKTFKEKVELLRKQIGDRLRSM